MKIIDKIGNTPLIELSGIEKEYSLNAKLFAKVEFFNPGGSIKDRIAYQMIKDAIGEGKINKDTVLIEPTSGNTGIGLALIAASMGLKLILTMPETMSIERRRILHAYGADLVLTEGKLGMKGAIAKANELLKANKNSFMPSQFTNPSNPKAHYLTTGPEIYRDLPNVDVLVAGIGTGGTISGAGKYLKEKNSNIKLIGVEPLSSAVITTGVSGSHKIQGIGAGFVPETLNLEILDKVITVSNEDAFKYAREVAKKEGILVGISSGAALAAAIELAKQKEYHNKNIVIIFPDGGDRYLSGELFNE